jgi:1,4-alpha-glucan branching enzyme
MAGREASDGAVNGPLNIYEVHLGSWMRHMDDNRSYNYRELAGSLIPYVKKMGYTHIALLPVTEYPFGGSLGYQVTGYYAPTGRYGRPEDFMYFVDMCHRSGIGVTADWVPAFFASDSCAMSRFDGTCVYENENARNMPGVLAFNHGNNQVKNFLIASALFWFDKYHLDGLRVCGVSMMLDPSPNLFNRNGWAVNHDAAEFIKHLNSIVGKTYKNVLMTAGDSSGQTDLTRPLEKGGFGFDLTWNSRLTGDFLSYISKEPVYRRYHHNNLSIGIVYAFSERYTTAFSHDEMMGGKKSLYGKMPGDVWKKFANLKLTYSYMFGHPGKKLLFMGGEFGQIVEWNHSVSLDWFLLEQDGHKSLHEFLRELNGLYASEPAFWWDDNKGTGFEWLSCNDSIKSTLSFLRKTDERKDTLLFAFNFAADAVEKHMIGVPYKSQWMEILNSDAERFGGSGVVNDNRIKSAKTSFDGREHSIIITLPPLGAVVLKQV